MDEELVTIAEYTSYLAAVAARDALRDAGIECFVPELLGDDDVRNAYHPYPGLFETRIGVQVGRSDAERAIAVLQEAGVLDDGGEEPEPHRDGPPPCPECESPHTRETRPPLLARVALLLTAAGCGPRARHWRCDGCGHRWEQ